MKTRSVLFLIISLLLAIIVFSGCSSSKKNDKAYSRVISNPDLADKTFRELEKTRPCITEPVEIRQGKDSVAIDTAYDENVDHLNDVIDSLLNIECPTPSHFNIDSLKRKIAIQVKTDCQPVIHYRTDTMFIQDTRRLNLSQSDYYKCSAEKVVLQQSYDAEKKLKNKWLFRFWLIVAAFGLGIFLRIKKFI